MGSRGKPCLVFAIAFLAAASFADSRKLHLETKPAFDSMAVRSGTLPLAITVANDGEDTSGKVVVQSDNYLAAYPMSLPRGARKRLFAYPPADDAGSGLVISLDTRVGRVVTNFAINEAPAESAIGLIGGHFGDLTLLRQGVPSSFRTDVKDAYGKPGSLPDRPCGYASFSALVFAEGAERMTDDEVEAIKTWAITGGSIIFLGGASSPVLRDPRWTALIPVESLQAVNVSNLNELEAMGGSRPPGGSVSLQVGSPRAGASVLLRSGRLPIILSRSFGLGRVLYLAFDPFERPLKPWVGWHKFFANGISGKESATANLWIATRANEAPWVSGPYDTTGGPFSATMPETSTIFWVLALYFAIAVPINFTVLRRLGKGEMAWLTTPIVSLGFAGVFFAFAGNLYKSGLSARTRGVVVAAKDHSEGYFMGSAQMFFPRGGHYDLKLKDVDSTNTRPGANGEYDRYVVPTYSERNNRPEIQDVGEIQVSDISVSNLSFRELPISQRVNTANWFSGSLKVNVKEKSLDCSLRNTAPYALANTSVEYGMWIFEIGELKPGEGIHRKIQAVRNPNPDAPWISSHLYVITGELQGFHAGPQIGEDAGSKCKLAYVWGSD